MMGKRARCAWAVAAVACWALATSAAAQTWVQDTWRQTIYYRTSFTAAAAADGQLRAAAADSYAVFLNGTPVGADTTAARMRAYPVRLAAGTNHLAVVVTQRGRGAGSGLTLSLATDSLAVPTTTDRSVAVWRWTATPQEGTAWRTASPGSGWLAVQSGTLDTAAIADLLHPAPEVVAGYPNGADVGSAEGGVRLTRILGRNLALGKVANRVETVDGDLTTAWEAPVASLNFTAAVDLRERFRINRVRVLTKGPGYAENSLRGYSVQISDDQVRWSEVAALHDIADYRRTEVNFTPTWTRYVRIVIVQINAVTQPRVAELEVYGDGYVQDGAYVSPPLALDPGSRPTNYGHVAWEATIPARTQLSVQFRTGDTTAELAAADTTAADSGWSAPLSAGGIWFPGQEPGRLLQYRVNMRTEDERRTPALYRLQVDYAAGDVPVSRASTWVVPNAVPMGRDTTFTCAVNLTFAAADLGVDRLQVVVPSEAVLDVAGVSGAGAAVAGWESGHDTLTVRFAAPLRAATTLLMPFRARTFANVHRFRVFAFSPGSGNPLNVGEDRSPDPGSGRARSWELLASTAPARALSQVRAAPAAFTPNGDGVNDDMVIEFCLAKVEIPRQVRIRILDLAGRPVALVRSGPLAAGAYQRLSGAGRGAVSPGWWDGRADGGQLVPPGIYLYRVEVDLDSGSEVRLGTVAVAY